MAESEDGPLPSVDHEHRVDLSNGRTVCIGPRRGGDRAALYAMFDDVVSTGDGYPHSPPLTDETFDAVWLREPVTTVVARLVAGPVSSGAAVGGRGGDLAVPSDGRVVGAYYLRPNFAGRAAHIANAGYMVDRTLRGGGVGRALVEDSIGRAPLAGYDAVQFNLVFVSNPARRLYEELGWREIGRVPQAIDGEDAVIYWRQVGHGLQRP